MAKPNRLFPRQNEKYIYRITKFSFLKKNLQKCIKKLKSRSNFSLQLLKNFIQKVKITAASSQSYADCGGLHLWNFTSYLYTSCRLQAKSFDFKTGRSDSSIFHGQACNFYRHAFIYFVVAAVLFCLFSALFCVCWSVNWFSFLFLYLIYIYIF